MADIDLKTATPDTSLPTTGFLFGADSQAAASPSVFTVQSVATTLLGSTTLTGATITADAPVLNLAQTWNASGVTFTGLRFNVPTNTSASGSFLMDLQIGGTSNFAVRRYTSGPYITLNNNGAWIGGKSVGGTNLLVLSGVASTGTDSAALSTDNFYVGSTIGLGFCAGSIGSNNTVDTILTRRGLANLRLGAADAASPQAQILSVQSVVAGTSNTAGQPFTITGSQGTGTGAGGSIIFQVAPAGSSGTAQNALATFLEATSARAFNLYNTTDVTTNFERGKIAWSSNVLQIGTEKGGTGTARALEFQTDGVTRLTIGTTGSITTPGTFSASSYLQAGSDVYLAGGTGQGLWFGGGTRSKVLSPTNGVLTIANSAVTDFDRLQFGGTTSSFPALKRNRTALETKLADDSAYAPHAMQYLDVTDGITAPASATGRARIYVDTADGDLKVIFADGTVKTIVTDT